MKVELFLNKKVDLKNHTLIEGFPGIGLVGTIAASYIVEKRKMEPIGYISSTHFPPMTSIHKGRPYFPARIYKDPNADFCVILSEFVVPAAAVLELAEDILDFAKNQKMRQIISLAGMTSTESLGNKPKIYSIVSSDELEKYFKQKNVELIREGVTTGVSGVLTAKCAVENFPAASLLVEAKAGVPDPRAAAILVGELDRLIGLKVDTKDLLTEAKKVEEKMKKFASQVKKGKASYGQEEPLPGFG
jgi:uncharacterized protein